MFKEVFVPIITPVRKTRACEWTMKKFEDSNFVQNLALDFVRFRNSSGLTESEKEKFKKAIKK